MDDMRTPITQDGVTYFMTFEQIHEVKRVNTQVYNIIDWFNTLPYKEKIKVRPDWKPAEDDSFFPDPEY